MKSALLFAAAVWLAIGTAACGDDDDDAVVDASAAVDAASTVDGGTGPGKLTIIANNITGATNKILLVFVTPVPAGSAVAAICQPITTSPQSVTAVAKTPGTGDPCTLGGEMTLPAANYDVRGGLYTPGQMTPSSCANATVTIAGNTSVTLPAFGGCP